MTFSLQTLPCKSSETSLSKSQAAFNHHDGNMKHIAVSELSDKWDKWRLYLEGFKMNVPLRLLCGRDTSKCFIAGSVSKHLFGVVCSRHRCPVIWTLRDILQIIPQFFKTEMVVMLNQSVQGELH